MKANSFLQLTIKRTRLIAAGCCLALLAWTIFSWQRANSAGSDDAPPAVVVIPPQSVGTPNVVSSGSGGILEQEHHFGLTLANEARRHRFRITNPSKSRWTFAGLTTTCSCTVSQVLAPVILPGEVGEVEVSYKAPAATLDDRKRVTAHFAEPEAPVVVLNVAARVREALTATRKTIELPRVGRGASFEEFLEIQNYSGGPLATPDVQTRESWLRATVRPLAVTPGPEEPRQAWRVGVRITTVDLESGGLSRPGRRRVERPRARSNHRSSGRHHVARDGGAALDVLRQRPRRRDESEQSPPEVRARPDDRRSRSDLDRARSG